MTEQGPLRDEAFPVTRSASETVYRGRIWDVRRDTFSYNGQSTVRDFVRHPGAVAVVALDEQRRVVLIQQYRHPIGERDWEIPAGLRDVAGEDPVETGRRELAEEADLVASRWEHLVTVHTTPGGSDETAHIFLAEGLSPADSAHPREAEEADIRAERVPLEDVVTGVLEGRLRNSLLAIGALAAAERLRRR